MPVEIELTQGKRARIDESQLHRVMVLRWIAVRIRGKWYAAHRRKMGERWETVYLHRFVLNAPPGVLVDHINGDTLDCRESNLRKATAFENQCNRGAQRQNRSGYKGVIFHPTTGKFQARIQAHGKKTHIGYFASAEEAARAYDKFARVIHGEFANLNFPKETKQ